MSLRTAVAAQAAALSTVLVAVAPATALPSLTTDRSCYAETEPITFTGQDFTPGTDIGFFFAYKGRFGNATTKADSAGAFTYALAAPELKDFDAEPPAFDLSITANDQSKLAPDGPVGAPEESFAFSQIRLSEWNVDIRPWDKPSAVAKRGQRFRLAARGWTSTGDVLYVHYLRGGKVVHSEKVGALKSPCGDLTTTIKAFTFKTAKAGKYAVRFSTSAKYSGKDAWLGYRAVRLQI